jgi:thymidylate synthase (FAD)
LSIREESLPVLDHGYVKYIEHWGSDERIIESARMSTNKGFLGWERESHWVCPKCGYLLVNSYEPEGYFPPCPACPGWPASPPILQYDKGSSRPGDKKLLAYLYKNHHDTPFEFAGLVIEVQAPLMVFREWHRHRAQSYNEMSARYTPLPDVNYRPTPERCLMVSSTNKQAGAASDNQLTHEQVLDWLDLLDAVYCHAEEVYKVGLEIGIPKELARLPVPVGRYSRMRAHANLRNWLAFLTLRSDLVPSGKYAQFEIRQFANAVGAIIQDCFPRTYELFVGTGR